MNSISILLPLNSGGNGLNGAVSSIAALAAASLAGEPEPLAIFIESNLPSLPIWNSTTTRFDASPFGGFQFCFMRLSSSRIYGPQLGDFIASIPGGPEGFPGPGFPIEPVPYPVPLEPVPPGLPEAAPLEPDAPPPVPFDVESWGDGMPDFPVPFPPDAKFPDEVPVPEDGLGPTGVSDFGTATLKGLFGAVASFGIEGFGGVTVGLCTGLCTGACAWVGFCGAGFG